MLISTMNDLPGYVIEEVFGEVFGLTVRARNIGSQLGAGLKSPTPKPCTLIAGRGKSHVSIT